MLLLVGVVVVVVVSTQIQVPRDELHLFITIHFDV